MNKMRRNWLVGRECLAVEMNDTIKRDDVSAEVEWHAEPALHPDPLQHLQMCFCRAQCSTSSGMSEPCFITPCSYAFCFCSCTVLFWQYFDTTELSFQLIACSEI